jgi:hypothetical protein
MVVFAQIREKVGVFWGKSRHIGGNVDGFGAKSTLLQLILFRSLSVL